MPTVHYATRREIPAEAAEVINRYGGLAARSSGPLRHEYYSLGKQALSKLYGNEAPPARNDQAMYDRTVQLLIQKGRL